MMSLTDKVALVTGGSRGIGRAIALRLAAAGADVVVNFAHSRGPADEVAAEIAALGRQVAVVQADVSQPDDVQAMVQWIGETFGRLNIVVSSAADHAPGPLLSATPDRFASVMTTNAGALIHLVQSAMPWLTAGPDRGKVVAVSAWGADVAMVGRGLLGASKAALEGTVRHLAFELGDRINFNVVQGGWIGSDGAQTQPDFDRPATGRANRLPLPTYDVEPNDIANVALFLASSLSDGVQGQTLVVDGGVTVRV